VIKSMDRNIVKEMIDTILTMNKEELIQLRNILRANQKVSKYNVRFDLALQEGAIDKDKKELIGFLPYALLNKKYFPSRISLVRFARRNLGINIIFPKSKSREAIIGSIIAEVANKDPRHISILVDALKRIIGKQTNEGIKDFFTEWDKIIRET